MDKNQIQNLLGQVKIINDKNAEILDATGGRFNIFKVCGVNHYENKHSAIIAEFLNPQGSHGLKHKFLKCFVETLGIDFKLKDFDCENARIYTERSTSNDGRIDILIEEHNRKRAIIIENKVYDPGRIGQVETYDCFAKKEYREGNYKFFYLTRFGNEAPKQSGQDVKYTCISYQTDIIAWLDKCVEIAARFPMVRETIIQYINHLKQLTNQDMDTKNKEEIVDLILKNVFIESAEYIHDNFDGVKRKILLNLGSILKEIATKNEIEPRFNIDDFAYKDVEDYLCECGKFDIYFCFKIKTKNLFFGLADNGLTD